MLDPRAGRGRARRIGRPRRRGADRRRRGAGTARRGRARGAARDPDRRHAARGGDAHARPRRRPRARLPRQRARDRWNRRRALGAPLPRGAQPRGRGQRDPRRARRGRARRLGGAAPQHLREQQLRHLRQGDDRERARVRARARGSGALRGGVLRAAARAARVAQPGFASTGGLHAAALFDARGSLLVAREDIGRHNAVDKVLGFCLREKRWPLAGHVLLVSGRISFEIAQKALAARVPVVAGVSAPSSLAIALAERAGMTLIGFLRGRVVQRLRRRHVGCRA